MADGKGRGSISPPLAVFFWLTVTRPAGGCQFRSAASCKPSATCFSRGWNSKSSLSAHGRAGLRSRSAKHAAQGLGKAREPLAGRVRLRANRNRSLATLRPSVLRQIVEEAIEPYFDFSLERRVEDAKSAWKQEAQEALAWQIDADALDVIRRRAAEKLEELRAAVTRSTTNSAWPWTISSNCQRRSFPSRKSTTKNVAGKPP